MRTTFLIVLLLVSFFARGIDDMNGRAFGNGFTNMKKRITAINGNLRFDSEKNKGTTVLIEGRLI